MKNNNCFVIFGDVVTPRQELIVKYIEKDIGPVTLLSWNRKFDAETSIERQNQRLIIKINMKSPTWSWKIIMRLPHLYLTYISILWRVKPNRVIVTHFILLGILKIYRPKSLITWYDAAEMHVLDLSYYIAPKFRRLFTKLLYKLEAWLLKNVNIITTVDSKDNWLLDKYQNHNVHVIWNVPSVTQEAPYVLGLGEIENVNDPVKIAFVGGLMLDKGLDTALAVAGKARALNQNIELHLFGPLKTSSDVLGTLMQRYDCSEIVRFRGVLPYKELQIELAKMQIGLALHKPTRIYCHVSAGNGRKFFTYMQSALAVIAPNFGNVSDAVRHANCGILVDTSNVDEVHSAVTRLIERPRLMRTFARNGYNFYQNFCNWELEETKLKVFISKIMKNL